MRAIAVLLVGLGLVGACGGEGASQQAGGQIRPCNDGPAKIAPLPGFPPEGLQSCPSDPGLDVSSTGDAGAGTYYLCPNECNGEECLRSAPCLSGGVVSNWVRCFTTCLLCNGKLLPFTRTMTTCP
jgi:hypothetical protein